PASVAPFLPLLRRWRHGRIAVEPLLHDKVVELLAPKQSRESLPLYGARVWRKLLGSKAVELVRFPDTCLEDAVEVGRGRVPVIEPCTQDARFARLQLELVPCAGFGPVWLRVDRLLAAVDDVLVEPVLIY